MEPHPNVLSRGESEAARVLNTLGGLLDETVAFGTHLFTWCLEVQPVKHTNLVISTLLHQFVETLDGVSVLVRQGCSEAVQPVMRSALESFLGLLFVLESDVDRRALCYHVTDGHRRLAILKRFDLVNPEAQAFRDSLRADTSGFRLGDTIFQDTSKAVSDLERKLEADDEIRAATAAWVTAKKRNNSRPPNWYALFDGPRNLRQLADHLHFPAWYGVLYGEWSATSHAADAMARVEIDPATGEAHVRGMRHPGELQVLTSIGCTMGVILYRGLVTTRVASRLPDFSAWYATIRERYKVVADTVPLITFREK